LRSLRLPHPDLGQLLDPIRRQLRHVHHAFVQRYEKLNIPVLSLEPELYAGTGITPLNPT
jgi:hypothetical protein